MNRTLSQRLSQSSQRCFFIVDLHIILKMLSQLFTDCIFSIISLSHRTLQFYTDVCVCVFSKDKNICINICQQQKCIIKLDLSQNFYFYFAKSGLSCKQFEQKKMRIIKYLFTRSKPILSNPGLITCTINLKLHNYMSGIINKSSLRSLSTSKPVGSASPIVFFGPESSLHKIHCLPGQKKRSY